MGSVRVWHLLALCCGVCPPRSPAVRAYLDCHLRRMCLNKHFLDEARFAQLALKACHRVQ